MSSSMSEGVNPIAALLAGAEQVTCGDAEGAVSGIPANDDRANGGGTAEVPSNDLHGDELLAARTDSLAIANLLSNNMQRHNSAHVQGVQVAGAQCQGDFSMTQGPIDWIGEAFMKEDGLGGGRKCYNGFVRDDMEVSVGDFVYVRAGEQVGIDHFIGQVKELYDSVEAHEQGQTVKMATVQWYYRPEELDLDAPLDVFDKEVFKVDEQQGVSLHMVVGKCRIVSPKEYWNNKVSAAARASLGYGSDICVLSPPADLYVCSKEYLREDRRVVPLENVPDDAPHHARDCRLEDHMLHPPAEKPKSKRRKKADVKVPKATRTTKRTKAAAAVAAMAAKEASDGFDDENTEDDTTDALAETSSADGEHLHLGGSRRKPKAKTSKAAASVDVPVEPKPVKRSRGGRIIKEPTDHYSVREFSNGNIGDYIASSPAGKKKSEPVSRGKYGRWAPDRFLLAQKNLVDVMKLIGATHPHKAILRPKLREEARRSVGDTGLLDYLLKHLADEVVSAEGEKLRRRHNRTGHMEYWLQDPQSAHEEDRMVNDEMNALSAELRQVREARNLLQTVREEAAEAVKVVEGVKSDPISPGDKKGAMGMMMVPAALQKALSNLKAQHEAHVKQSDEEAKRLRETIDTLVQQHKELKNRIDDMSHLMSQLKGILDDAKVNGNLDIALDNVLYPS